MQFLPFRAMPGSSTAGRKEGLEMLLKIDPPPASILDVGPGAGQWWDWVAPWFPEAKFNAIEIFEPYIERFKLRDRYHHVLWGDVREVAPLDLPAHDLIIFGDVLEHMPRIHAIAVVEKLLYRHALISIPVGECPQEPTDENPYEEHVATWETKDIFEAFTTDWCRVLDDFAYQYPPPHYGRGVFLLERIK